MPRIDRLFGFGVLPFQDIKACVSELERVSSYDRLRGVILGTSGAGRGLDDPAMRPIYEAAEALGLMLFLHPHYGLGHEQFAGMGHALHLALGFPFETTAAVCRLVLSGTIDRFPQLRVLLAHSGGTLPFLAGRLDSCVKHDHAVASKLQHAPSYYLRQLYYDALSYHSPAIRCAVSFAGIDRVMFGTDHPFFPPPESNGRCLLLPFCCVFCSAPLTDILCVLRTASIPDSAEWPSTSQNFAALHGAFSSAEISAICRDNAVRILKLPLL